MWTTIRRATQDDRTRLTQTEEAFRARHSYPATAGLDLSDELAYDITQGNCEAETLARHLWPLWRRCVQRALGCVADGIVGDTVGYHVS